MLDFSIIGKNIRTNRQGLGITQEALAETLNVTPDYISKIENGTKHPSMSMIEKLAEIFKTDIYELMVDPSVDVLEDINPQIYKIMKNWEPETRKFVSKAAETFTEVDKALQELKDQ